MNVPEYQAALQALQTQDVAQLMQGMGLKAKTASAQMARAPAAIKNRALIVLANLLRRSVTGLEAANKLDLDRATAAGLTGPMLDRLKLGAKDLEIGRAHV